MLYVGSIRVLIIAIIAKQAGCLHADLDIQFVPYIPYIPTICITFDTNEEE